MSPAVAVIIPARNEEAMIQTAVRSAWKAGAAEVIVADCGSQDETAARAREERATVLTSDVVRGAHVNVAANSARSEILLFLHADSRLREGSLAAVEEAIRRGFIFGGFRVRFVEGGFLLRATASLINGRTRLTRCPWGDQAQFVRRDVFLETGGFKPYPLLEDYELANRMKRIGRTTVLKEFVITSGRRFLTNGFLRTPLMNWRIILAYRLGADPNRLERLYRGE